MQITGAVAALELIDGVASARIVCDPRANPSPGQYLLAAAQGSPEPLASALFAIRYFEDGFIADGPAPVGWQPGTALGLRGPLGHGFSLPSDARRVALIALDAGPRRLLALMDSALRQSASVALVCEDPPDDLPLELEVQPLVALATVCSWADYAAVDVPRESLGRLITELRYSGLTNRVDSAEVLVRTPMPCGGLGECGICTVRLRKGTRLACCDGPVLRLGLLALEG